MNQNKSHLGNDMNEVYCQFSNISDKLWKLVQKDLPFGEVVIISPVVHQTFEFFGVHAPFEIVYVAQGGSNRTMIMQSWETLDIDIKANWGPEGKQDDTTIRPFQIKFDEEV